MRQFLIDATAALPTYHEQNRARLLFHYCLYLLLMRWNGASELVEEAQLGQLPSKNIQQLQLRIVGKRWFDFD